MKLRTLVLVTLLGASLSGCAGLAAVAKGVAPIALGVAKNLLQTTASNYLPGYETQVAALMHSLGNSLAPGIGATGVPGSATPGVGTAASSIEPSSASTVDAPPLELHVALLQQIATNGRLQSVPIRDGDTLHRGESDETSDRLQVFCEVPEDCYLYIVWIDGSGWVQPLFPSDLSDLPNPVPAGSAFVLPGDGEAFAMDEVRGVETVFFVASREPRDDLEELIERFQGQVHERNPFARAEHQIAEVEEPAIIERGVGRTRTGTGRDRAGNTFTTNEFLSEFGATELVITRWFHHR